MTVPTCEAPARSEFLFPAPPPSTCVIRRGRKSARAHLTAQAQRPGSALREGERAPAACSSVFSQGGRVQSPRRRPLGLVGRINGATALSLALGGGCLLPSAVCGAPART